MKPAAFLVLAAWLLSALAVAQTTELSAEYIATPLIEDGRPVRLELLVRKPKGVGPFPTVVFNHGSTGRGDNPELFKRSWSSDAVASYFVERGWMVIFPQRRGRGGSEGRYDEGFEPDRSRYSCEVVHSLPGVERAIQDLDAVMAHVLVRSDVEQSRIVLAGQSRGGILSIAYAGERPSTFIGVVNFVGGWMGDRCQNAVEINTTTFKQSSLDQPSGSTANPTLSTPSRTARTTSELSLQQAARVASSRIGFPARIQDMPCSRIRACGLKT